MAYNGQVLENPVGGERVVFRETASDTRANCSRSSSSSPRTATSPTPTSARSKRSA